MKNFDDSNRDRTKKMIEKTHFFIQYDWKFNVYREGCHRGPQLQQT